MYLQCDGTLLPRDPHVPGDLDVDLDADVDVDGDPVQAQQSPPVLLSALTSAGRRDNWDFCSPKKYYHHSVIQYVMSNNMHLKIYCASDISNRRKYISLNLLCLLHGRSNIICSQRKEN